MSNSEIKTSSDAILNLFALARRARRAETASSLQFMLVNQTMSLVPYLLSQLWAEDEGVILQSGVSYIERNSPFTLWSNQFALSLADQEEVCVVKPEMLSSELLSTWDEYLPEHALWLPISTYSSRAGLLIARADPFDESEIALIKEWIDIWSHAWVKLAAPSVHGELRSFWLKLTNYLPTENQIKKDSLAVWRGAKYLTQRVISQPKSLITYIKNLIKLCWMKFRSAYKWLKKQGFYGSYQAFIFEVKEIWANKHRRWKWLFWIFIFFPVRLTVLAPGELVPANPAIIRVPIEGVVDEFYVAPNERVVAGQPLFKLDLTSLLSKLQVAQQEIQIATQEYRQSALQSLTDSKSRGMLASQEGKATERKIEADYLQEMLNKAKIESPRDGIVIFDDPSEWIGKPVVAGEKVMVVATEGKVEIEAWIPVGDVLEVPKDAPVTLYLNASPFSPVSGYLRFMGHEPIQRPDGNYAYRVRAILDSSERGARVGLKGTAKISGQFVPFSYWVLRKPLASLRQYIGF